MSSDKKLIKWLFSRRVGSSAKTIAAALAGIDNQGFNGFSAYNASVPLDCGDLGRCIFLLDSVPEFRPRLAMVGERFAMFRPYIEHWEELEKLYRESHSPAGDRLAYPAAIAARHRCRKILDSCRATASVEQRRTEKWGKG
jgi:hypothetical protein